MPLTKDELIAQLRQSGIALDVFDHPSVHTVEEARALRGEIHGVHCKNLFLKDKKDQLWLLVCEETASVNLKTVPDRIGAARLSFGRSDLLFEALGIEPGSVTPLAAVNDTAGRVRVVLDRAIATAPRVCCHPLTNTSTVALSSADLIGFLRSVDHDPLIADIVDPVS
jgi:Ala-tRNA(Pro) deacylase